MAADRMRPRIVVSYHGPEAAGMVAERLVTDHGVLRGDLGVDRPDDRAAVAGWSPVRPDVPLAGGVDPNAQRPGAAPERPGLAMGAWVTAPAGATAGFVLLFLLGLVVPDGGQGRMVVAIIMGAVGSVVGGVVGALFGRARHDLVAAAGRAERPTSVLSVPADVLGDEPELLRVLGGGPVDAMWATGGPDGPSRRLTDPTSDPASEWRADR
jgi:hypothetical protein